MLCFSHFGLIYFIRGRLVAHSARKFADLLDDRMNFENEVEFAGMISRVKHSTDCFSLNLNTYFIRLNIVNTMRFVCNTSMRCFFFVYCLRFERSCMLFMAKCLCYMPLAHAYCLWPD